MTEPKKKKKCFPNLQQMIMTCTHPAMTCMDMFKAHEANNRACMDKHFGMHGHACSRLMQDMTQLIPRLQGSHVQGSRQRLKT
eukprot:1646697-Amphidinium_carterae.1